MCVCVCVCVCVCHLLLPPPAPRRLTVSGVDDDGAALDGVGRDLYVYVGPTPAPTNTPTSAPTQYMGQ